MNLNLGNKGEPLYLYFRREPGAPMVVEIRFFYGNHAPDGFIVLFPDLNKGLSLSKALYMCYRVADVRPEAVDLRPESGDGSQQQQQQHATAQSTSAKAANTASPALSAEASKSQQAAKSASGMHGMQSSSGGVLAKQSGAGTTASRHSRRGLYAVDLLHLSHDTEHAIGLEVDGFAPLRGLAISEVGETMLEVTTSAGSGRKVRLLLEVRVHNGVREVMVRSPLRIENGLKHTVDLCIPGFSSSQELSVALSPSKSFSPPLGLLDDVNEDDMLLPLLRFFDPLAQRHVYATDPREAVAFNPSLKQVCNLGFLYRYQLEGTVPLWITRLTATTSEFDCVAQVPGMVSSLTYSLTHLHTHSLTHSFTH